MAARRLLRVGRVDKARAVTSQAAGFILGWVGVSRISMPTSKPPASTAEKVAVSLSSLVPDEGVIVERIVDR